MKKSLTLLLLFAGSCRGRGNCRRRRNSSGTCLTFGSRMMHYHPSALATDQTSPSRASRSAAFVVGSANARSHSHSRAHSKGEVMSQSCDFWWIAEFDSILAAGSSTDWAVDVND